MHIGFYRTGTTSLQQNVIKNIKNYIILGPYSKECKIISKYTNDLSENNYINRLQKCKFLLKKNSKYFVSEEGLVGSLNDNYKNVSLRLKFYDELFNNPTYILTIRSQKNLIFSSWLKSLTKTNYSFHQYISKNNFVSNKPESLSQPIDYKVLNYYKILQPYFKIKNRVSILIFEKLLLDQKYYFDEISKIIGSYNLQFLTTKKNTIFNKSKFSFSLKPMFYLPDGSYYTNKKSFFSKIMGKISINNPLSDFYIFLLRIYNFNSLKKIYEYHKNDNNKFEKQWELDLKNLNYY